MKVLWKEMREGLQRKQTTQSMVFPQEMDLCLFRAPPHTELLRKDMEE